MTLLRKTASWIDTLAANKGKILGSALGGLGLYGISKGLGASTPLAVGLGLGGAVAGGYGGAKLDDHTENLYRSQINKIPDDTARRIRELAIMCGVRPDVAERSSATELLSDTRSALKNDDSYYGKTLDERQLKTLRRYLNTAVPIMQIIEEQDKYIKSLGKNRVVVLPRESED